MQWVAYWVIFGGKAEGVRGANHPPSSRAKVKESVELYLNSPSSPFTDTSSTAINKIKERHSQRNCILIRRIDYVEECISIRQMDCIA